jgi:hypothetical protein
MVRNILFVIGVGLLCATSAFAQGKGVDQQNKQIRDNSNQRAPGLGNGSNQSNGTGRGIDFGRGKTEDIVLPNPFRFTARRDALRQSVEELMLERNIVVDTAASKADAGLVISQPYTFTKGAVVSQSELNRYANLPPSNSRGWTRGRMTYIVEVQPIDAVTQDVSVNIKLEGRTDGVTGGEWSTLVSNGFAEQEFMGALVEKINGSMPKK